MRSSAETGTDNSRICLRSAALRFMRQLRSSGRGALDMDFFSENATTLLAIGFVLGLIALLCVIAIIHSKRSPGKAVRNDPPVDPDRETTVVSSGVRESSADPGELRITGSITKEGGGSSYKSDVSALSRPADTESMQLIYSFPEDSMLIICPNCGVETTAGDPYCAVCAQPLRHKVR